jgi:hypothetical protein
VCLCVVTAPAAVVVAVVMVFGLPQVLCFRFSDVH